MSQKRGLVRLRAKIEGNEIILTIPDDRMWCRDRWGWSSKPLTLDELLLMKDMIEGVLAEALPGPGPTKPRKVRL